jgi:Microsomal signal peptidase 25 kDa subunit (SPC25)
MPYLTTLPKPYKFTVNNTNSNVRLVLGYSAVTIAGIAFYLERKLGWEVTQPWMLPAVLIYFALNLALTIWIWGVEAGQIFEGTREGGEKVRDWIFFPFVFVEVQ